METGGRATAATKSSVPTDPFDLCEIHLADLQGATGVFSGHAVDHTLACTETESTVCQIIRHLSTWNEILFQVPVEALEQPRKKGGLTISSIWTTRAIDHGETTLHRAFTLLCCLLKNHRCVKALHLTIQDLVPHGDLIRDALRGNGHIESFELVDFTPDRIGYCSYFPILPSLRNLKVFECACDELPQPCLEALTALLRTTSTLESLNIPHVRKTSAGDPTRFFIALTVCPSLKELSLNLDVFDLVPAQCCQVFARYLGNTSTLTTLSFTRGCDFRTDSRKVILRGLCANKSIVKLEMEGITIDEEAVEIIATLFFTTTNLHSVHICPLSTCFFPAPTLYCDSWLRALAETIVLEELTLPFNIWRPQQWRAFFGMLATKHSLKMVIIGCPGPERARTHFRELCNALRESAVEEKVTIKGCINSSCFNDDIAALQCKSFVGISASTRDDGNGAPQLPRLLRELTSLSHVRTLSLTMEAHDSSKELFSAFADYIGATTTLKRLRLEFRVGPRPVEDVHVCWKTIIESLSRNRSIAVLAIGTYSMCAEDMEYLSEVIRCSETVRVFYDCFWNARGAPSDAFEEHLSRGIASNYSLVRVSFSAHSHRQAFDVRDTVRRNSSLVARAARLRQQADLERFTAGALERIWRHRALLHELADVLSVSVDEATTAVRASYRAFEDLNAFMRLAGIVRFRVECYPRRDGRPQLDDLNEPCWRALRRYIMLDDVTTEAPSA